MRTIKLITIYYSGLIKAKLEYRFSFFVQTLVTLSGIIVGYLSIWVLVSSFDEIAGWNAPEMFLLYALGTLCYSCADMIFGTPMKWLGRWAKQGDFDSILIRPVNPLLYVLLKQFSFKFAPVVVSLLTLFIALSSLDCLVSTLSRALLPLTVLGGVLIEASLMIVAGSLGLKFFETQSAVKMLTNELRRFTDYPLSIFPECISYILTFVIPLAFVNYIPAMHLTGKDSFPDVIMLTPLFVGYLLFFAAYMFFLHSVKRYASTGS